MVDDYLRGGVSSTQTFLGMVDDDDVGQLTLSRDRVRVRWAGAGRSAVYRSIEQALTTATGSPGVDGVYVRSPFGNVTVHPLGGCVMAENGAAGVVDDTGAVFAGTGTETYPGLYVCDGAIIPRALIANPLLAISALAERAAPHILEATR
jgi:cholesterol oxidase